MRTSQDKEPISITGLKRRARTNSGVTSVRHQQRVGLGPAAAWDGRVSVQPVGGQGDVYLASVSVSKAALSK